MKFRKDLEGTLESLSKKIIEKEPDYLLLKSLKILYIWREGKPRTSEDGGIVAAQANLLPSRQRDLFGYDCQIEVCEDIWNTLPNRWKKRLLWHELRHFKVETEEDDSGKLVPVKDKEGRTIIKINPHDIVLKTFKAEVEKFGLDVDEIGMTKFLSKMYRKSKKGLVKKYARPSILRVKEEEQEEAEKEGF